MSMGGKTLIDSTTRTYVSSQLLQMYNDEARKRNAKVYSSLAAALVGAGITGLSLYLTGAVAAALAPFLGAASLILGVAGLISAIVSALNSDSQFDNCVRNMINYGGSAIRVTTKVYQWMSGSGNHTARITETNTVWY